MTLSLRRETSDTPMRAGTQPWTGRTAITLVAIGVGLLVAGDRVPSFAYWSLILVALYLLLTNAGAAARAIDYVTNPNS